MNIPVDQTVSLLNSVLSGYSNQEKKSILSESKKSDWFEIGNKLLNNPITNNVVTEFRLDVPENLVKFFVDFNLAFINTVIDSFTKAERERFLDIIASIEAINENIVYLKNNPTSNTKAIIEDQLLKLNDHNKKLQKKMLLNIDEIKAIDGQNRYMFFLTSIFNLPKVKSNNFILKGSAQCIITITFMFSEIGNILGTNTNNFIEDNKNFLAKNIFETNNWQLLEDYDYSKGRDHFWKELRNRMDTLPCIHEELIQVNKTLKLTMNK